MKGRKVRASKVSPAGKRRRYVVLMVERELERRGWGKVSPGGKRWSWGWGTGWIRRGGQ